MTKDVSNRNVLPSFARVRDLLNYDPETGNLTWRISGRGHIRAGHPAGCKAGNRIVLSIDGVCYKAHRIIWLWVTGVAPSKRIDHEDMDGLNNRWKNIRLATNSQNMANRGKQSNNSTGLKGAYRNNGSWASRIKKDGVDYYIGNFLTREEAHAAYIAKARELFGEFARGA